MIDAYSSADSQLTDNTSATNGLNDNPYAVSFQEQQRASQTTGVLGSNRPERGPVQMGGWRDGPYVVTFRNGQLPPYCYLTGDANVGQPYQQLLRYHWFRPFQLFATTAHCATVTFSYGASVAAAERRSTIWRVLLTGLGAFLPLPIAVYSRILPSPISALAMVAALVVFETGIVVGIVLLGQRPIRAVRMENQFVWISGAGTSFLARLPDWPGEDEAIAIVEANKAAAINEQIHEAGGEIPFSEV